MLSEQDIIQRLEQLGYSNAEIRTAMRDVAQVIVVKTAAEYMKRFPEDVQDHLRTLSEADVQAYLDANAQDLPQMSQDDFDKLHNETWEDYFTAMSQ